MNQRSPQPAMAISNCSAPAPFIEKTAFPLPELQWHLCPKSSVGLFLDSSTCSICLFLSYDHIPSSFLELYTERLTIKWTMASSHTKIELEPTPKPNHNLCRNWPTVVITWSMSAPFPKRQPSSNLEATRESHICPPRLSPKMSCFYSACP